MRTSACCDSYDPVLSDDLAFQNFAAVEALRFILGSREERSTLL